VSTNAETCLGGFTLIRMIGETIRAFVRVSKSRFSRRLVRSVISAPLRLCHMRPITEIPMSAPIAMAGQSANWNRPQTPVAIERRYGHQKGVDDALARTSQ
jgi:hypothetical protein